MQVKDRMDILQTLLDSKPYAFKDQATLDNLSNQLGLGSKAQELELRIAKCAMREEDRAVATSKCLQLVRSGFKPAWELCAQLAVTHDRDGLEPGAMRQLLGFVLAHCPQDQARLLLNMAVMLKTCLSSITHDIFLVYRSRLASYNCVVRTDLPCVCHQMNFCGSMAFLKAQDIQRLFSTRQMIGCIC